MRYLTAIGLLLCASASSLGAWVPTDCNDKPGELSAFHREIWGREAGQTWNNYRQGVLKARPGSPLYAPYPYPKNEKEIIEDFRYAYFEHLFRMGSVPPREQPIYNAMKEGRLRIEVQKLENWAPDRCTSSRPKPFYHLLRFFDPGTGKELTNAKELDSGLLASYSYVGEGEEPLPSLDDLPALLSSRFGFTLPIEQPQYVQLSGLPFCGEQVPCVAFKSRGKIYLLDFGKLLYVVDPAAPRASVIERHKKVTSEDLKPLGMKEVDSPTVSLGFELGRAQRVAGQAPARRK